MPVAPARILSALMCRTRGVAAAALSRTRAQGDLHDDELVAADARLAVGQGGGTLGLRRQRNLGQVHRVRQARTAGLPTQGEVWGAHRGFLPGVKHDEVVAQPVHLLEGHAPARHRTACQPQEHARSCEERKSKQSAASGRRCVTTLRTCSFYSVVSS